jgi:hypothetical protein
LREFLETLSKHALPHRGCRRKQGRGASLD